MKEKQRKFSLLIAQFIVWLYGQGFTVRGGDWWRSTDKLFIPTGDKGFDDDSAYSYQELLFYNNKTKLTYGKHNDRLALDMVIEKDDKQITDEDLKIIGSEWERMGGRWGGRFGLKLIDGKWVDKHGNESIGWDAGHFEL